MQGLSEPRGLLNNVGLTNTFTVHQENCSDKSSWHDPDVILQIVDQLVAKLIVEFHAISPVLEWVKLRIYELLCLQFLCNLNWLVEIDENCAEIHRKDRKGIYKAT